MINHPVVQALIVLHFTVGFFMGLFFVLFYWEKGMREYLVERSDEPGLVRGMAMNRLFLFVGMVLVGFPALVITVILDIRALK